MSGYQLTPQAISDLFGIWDFIAADNPAAADLVETAIFRAFDFLSISPHASRTREDLTALPVRCWVLQPYSNYMIVYDAEKRPLQVIRILHTSRDLPSILR